MNDRMRKGCCRLLALLLTLVLVIPAYGQETLDALAAAQGCTAETLLQSDRVCLKLLLFSKSIISFSFSLSSLLSICPLWLTCSCLFM